MNQLEFVVGVVELGHTNHRQIAAYRTPAVYPMDGKTSKKGLPILDEFGTLDQ